MSLFVRVIRVLTQWMHNYNIVYFLFYGHKKTAVLAEMSLPPAVGLKHGRHASSDQMLFPAVVIIYHHRVVVVSVVVVLNTVCSHL